MAGVGTTAARTSMIVPSPPAPRALPASIVWPPSLVCAQKERQVRLAEEQRWKGKRTGEHSGLLPLSLSSLLGYVLLSFIFWNMALKAVLLEV